jgi:thioredoxin-like negative regulator of GroEL
MAGQVRFAKLNVDENPLTAARFDARRIPLLVIFKAGREVDRIVGLMPRAALAARLAQTLGA